MQPLSFLAWDWIMKPSSIPIDLPEINVEEILVTRTRDEKTLANDSRLD